MTESNAKPYAPSVSLKALAVLSILVPVLICGAIGAFRYNESSHGAEMRVSRSLRVAHEHASKVVGAAEALQDRLVDLVDGQDPAQLRARQAALHAILAAKVQDEQQIQSIWIIGADGMPIASSLATVPPGLDFTDRDYFAHHRDGRPGRFLSPPLKSRTTGAPVLDISTRFNGPDGRFAGVVNVSLHTAYFESFYGDLVNDEPGLAVTLFREDGPIFTRWPRLPNAPERMGKNSPTLQLVASGAPFGTVRGVSSIDGRERLVSFRKVADYPLFVGTGMDISEVRANVARELAILLALTLPPFGAIFYAARMASRRAREAYEAAEHLSAEMASRRKAEEALLQAQKLEALGRLTGGVAHDFNNALMVISNNAFLLQRHVSDKGASQLESIGRAVDSATKLTRQLLAFSRRQALVPEQVNLQARLPAAHALLAPVLGSQVKLAIAVAPDTRPITVDLAELELALLNLAINARDAMPAGGQFTVDARNASADEVPHRLREVAAVVVEARDTGQGIDPAVLHKVFEPFFTTKPVGAGTGLGLSQVYGLCERAGGQAGIDSELGRGTRVRLYFPAAAAGAESAESAAPAVRRHLGKTVLVVEDNDEVAATLVQLLDALGCKVTRVQGSDAALEWLAARPQAPDLVLSDVVMPGAMDGLALATYLRRLHPELRVVLMTGYAERMDAIEAQGHEVLPKPCTPEVLAAMIERDKGSPGPAGGGQA